MELLSHYTPEIGLIGIVRSQSIWATEVLALNDREEFVYALSALLEEALERVLHRIPGLRAEDTKLLQKDTIIQECVSAIQKRSEEDGGFGSLYVASFARGKRPRQDEEGILSLWSRYTDCKGYCLQFSRCKLDNLINSETLFRSFAWLGLAEVTYGVDKTEMHFNDIADQFSYRIMQDCFRRTRDKRFLLNPPKTEPDSTFLDKVVRFCARHKSEDFEDEREVRIFACPVGNMLPTFPRPKLPKTIYRRNNHPNGARYIVLGEGVIPGLVPDRIIIGPKANMRSYMWESLYPLPPKLKNSSIPVR